VLRANTTSNLGPVVFVCFRLLAITGALVFGIDAQAVAQNVTQPQDLTLPGEASVLDNLPNKGDPSGLRKWLDEHGLKWSLYYTNDILSNLSGGIKRGTIDQGKLDLQVTTDLDKVAGLKGLTFYWNAFEIYNTGRIRRDYVGGMNTIAAIEAAATVRLSELWLEQKFLNDAASIRVGQLAADQEFFFSELSQFFLQSDYPTIAAVNQPGEGPSYPLSTPGARLRFDLGKQKETTLLFGVFNGDPAGPCPGDPDTCNRYGLNFRVRDPALLYAEAQFRRNQQKDDAGLASSIKVGGWSHLGQFADQHYDVTGLSLASPLSSGIPAMHRGDSGIYGIVDQQLYRPKGGSASSGISVFTRASWSPPDRNLVDKYLDGGIVFNGLVPGRPDDMFGAAFIYAHFSNSVRALDLDQIAFGNLITPARDYEANFEFTYVARVMPGWTVQPVFTYIAHPSGTGVRYPDAKVAGVRSVMKF
jgi:porin